MNDSSITFKKVNQLQVELTQERYHHWVHYELFTWQWWLIVFLWFAIVILLLKLIDKKRLIEILFYGTFLAYLATALDAIGAEIGEWSYEYKEIPLFNRLMIADTTIIPVTYMLVYQYCRNWKSFFIGQIIVAAVFAFIGEVILEWMNIYHPHGWKHIYSFPIYICIGVFMRWLIIKIKTVQDRGY